MPNFDDAYITKVIQYGKFVELAKTCFEISDEKLCVAVEVWPMDYKLIIHAKHLYSEGIKYMKQFLLDLFGEKILEQIERFIRLRRTMLLHVALFVETNREQIPRLVSLCSEVKINTGTGAEVVTLVTFPVETEMECSKLQDTMETAVRILQSFPFVVFSRV
jgi:hypothetical protein